MYLYYYWNKYLRKSIVFAAFLVSVFLIKIPPLYFLGIKSSLATTHSFSRVIILLLFVLLGVVLGLKKKLVFSRQQRILVIGFLIYFLFQSISVLAVVDAASFARVYKDIVFAGFFLFVTLFEGKYLKSVVWVFILAGIVNFFYQMAILWFPQAFQVIGQGLVYAPHLELVNINIARGRLFVETYDEIAIPFLILLISAAKKNKARFFYTLVLAAIVGPSLLSNFRTRILMLAFALAASLFLLLKRSSKAKIFLISGVALLGLLAHILSSAVFGFSFVNRVALENEQEDVRTIGGRLENLKISLAMGLSRPLSGVGLGEFPLYIPENKKSIFSVSLNPFRKEEAGIASRNPHNILAQTISETGVLSFIFFLILLGVFAKGDISRLRAGESTQKAFIISFWTLFIYSLFNPSTTLGYNSLFWILRAGIIEPK